MNESLVYLHDLYPTICKFAGIARIPNGVEGKALPGLFDNKSTQIRDSLFTTYANKIRAVRKGRYKLIRWPQIDKTQLFDLQDDPDEMNDLAELPEHEKLLATLMDSLKEWQSKVDDPHPLIVKNPKPAEVDLTGKSRKPDSHQPKWIVDKYFK